MDINKIDELLFGETHETVVKSDYAIVLGTAPEYVSLRAEIAASFYRKGGTEKIIASGAAVSDESVTECAVIKKQLIKCGVPIDAIIEEPRAYDTIQNMTCSLTELCKRTDITEVKSVTVITEPFHIKRAFILASIFFPRFIKVYGYTEGTAVQREEWKKDARLNACVKTEIEILKQLSAKGLTEEL